MLSTAGIEGELGAAPHLAPAADLWDRIWHKLDNIGIEGIEICKCKGHATEGAVQAGRSTQFLRRGNDHADHFAG